MLDLLGGFVFFFFQGNADPIEDKLALLEFVNNLPHSHFSLCNYCLGFKANRKSLKTY